MKNHILTLILFLSIACTPFKKEPDQEFGWKKVYKHDENGKAISGSIDSLIAGIRKGYAVRVGWGWKRERGDSTITLEHTAIPLFLSVIQGKEVSVIIDPHPLLKNYLNMDQQDFNDVGNTWHCVMTSRGSFNARVYDHSGKLVHDWPQKQRITWFLEYPNTKHTSDHATFYD